MTSSHFHLPTSLDDLQKLYSNSSNAVLVAGGQAIVPRIKSGHVRAENVISLERVVDLRGSIDLGETIRVGAAETHHAIADSSMLQTELNLLTEIAGQVGDAPTRYRGTIGGALCADACRTDYAGILLATDATLVTSQRSFSAANFYDSSASHQLVSDEVLLAIEFKKPKWGGFRKIAHPAGNYAEVGVCVSCLATGEYRVIVYGENCSPNRVMALEDEFNESATGDLNGVLERHLNRSTFFESRLFALLSDTLNVRAKD